MQKVPADVERVSMSEQQESLAFQGICGQAACDASFMGFSKYTVRCSSLFVPIGDASRTSSTLNNNFQLVTKTPEVAAHHHSL
jgi:hypothetical protein